MVCSNPHFGNVRMYTSDPSSGMLRHGGAVQVRQRKLEEGREGKYKGRFKRLSGRVSGSGQRWRRNHLTSRSADPHTV